MKRTQKSQKRTKFLLLLIVLTAILSITATYAWFSTQRDVDITGMRLNVEVAESMQISLDGEVWTQSIQIANMRQFYGTYNGTGDAFTIYDAKSDDNTNYVPTELEPVSSAGEVVAGKLQLVKGNVIGTSLTGVKPCTETDLTKDKSVSDRQSGNANHPYLVFDMYLRNVSARGAADGNDPLLLNAGSNVWINTNSSDDSEQEGAGVSGTGLEYSARVGMIVYGNTVSINETGSATQTVGEMVRAIAPNNSEKAAIWEPNDRDHTPYVVSNNGMSITSTTQAVTTKALKAAAATTSAAGGTVDNIYNDANLSEVATMKPAYTLGTGVNAKTAIKDVDGGDVTLKPNTISKVRVYIWLEGQDPDCVDLASTGDKLNVTLKLTKNEFTNGANNTYAN